MKLVELPLDVLFNIFNNLSATSLIRLGSTCRALRDLTADDLLWKHLAMDDYNFPAGSTYRSSGWKALYSRLSDSRVFTWGENSDGRLGHPNLPLQRDPHRGRFTQRPFITRHIDSPRELLSLRGKGIVDIHAGGWSFHALDRHGRAWMWGKIQNHNGHGFGQQRVPEPTEVSLPSEICLRSISCGRSHTIGLARDGSVWHWCNIRTPQRIRTPSPILQVTANWGYSTLLSTSGEIFIVSIGSDEESVEDYVVEDPPVTLKLIQDDMVAAGQRELNTFNSNDQIVQIAGLENTTLCLTRYGRVLRLATDNTTALIASPAMCTTELHNFGAVEPELNDPKKKMHRFITAQFRSFAVYTSDGKVLLGSQDTLAHDDPRILPELQHDICKVSFGDYHSGALTNGGKLLTWGRYSAGALGLGNSGHFRDTENPEEVPFGNMFVFGIGFGGWHSGALAIPRD